MAPAERQHPRWRAVGVRLLRQEAERRRPRARPLDRGAEPVLVAELPPVETEPDGAQRPGVAAAVAVALVPAETPRPARPARARSQPPLRAIAARPDRRRQTASPGRAASCPAFDPAARHCAPCARGRRARSNCGGTGLPSRSPRPTSRARMYRPSVSLHRCSSIAWPMRRAASGTARLARAHGVRPCPPPPACPPTAAAEE